MVTARLTASAVQAQIASQRQRVQALEASLRTMESGMEKHMTQVGACCKGNSLACICVHAHMRCCRHEKNMT